MTVPYLERNNHFQRLFSDPDLLWLGQNTNHLPSPPAVKEALIKAVQKEEYHAYAPPAGLTELHQLILNDLDLRDAAVIITDGAIEGLYHACRLLIGPGERFITTDPGWKWPGQFARISGAEIVELPIYEADQNYKLSADQLAQEAENGAKIIYLIDPLNPLGVSYSAEEIEAFANIARDSNAYLIHDCTYRQFAESHTLAYPYYPERTITTYSFSKWLGLAGLRLGAIVGTSDLMNEFSKGQPNNLGSNILSQRAAIAGLGVKSEWFPEIQKIQRQNQILIREAVAQIQGLNTPVFPSQGNFLVIDCSRAGISPETLTGELLQNHIMIRQAAYHSRRYGDRFVKISTTVPVGWVEQFCNYLPDAVERASAIRQPAGDLY